MKDIIDNKTNKELVESLIAEQAKAVNELRCSQNDITKAKNRLSFSLMLLNKITDRLTDNKD